MKIVAGIVGLGVGIKHFDAINSFKDSKVKLVCDLNKKKLIRFKAKFPFIRTTANFQELIDDPEINLISIASYDHFHCDQLIKAIKKNKNIIIEKPLCLNQIELQKIIKELKKKKNLGFVSNFVLRREPIFIFLKKIFNKKNFNFAELDYIWGRPHKLKDWRTNNKDYNIVLGAGVHIIDIVNWITGDLPYEVTGIGQICNRKKYNKLKYTNCSFFLNYKKGYFIKISINATSPHPHFHNIKFFSESLTILNEISGIKKIKFRGKKTLIERIDKIYPDKKMRKKQIQNFLMNLKNKKNNLINFKETINCMSIAFAANKAITTNKKVKIKYFN